jgi:cytoskeletal protein CcmA (bactofilin family)
MSNLFQGRWTGGGDDAGAGVRPDSLISGGVTLVGDIITDGDLRVDGSIRGAVHAGGSVTVSEEGSVHGEVIAEEVVVAGHLDGDVRGRDAVRVRSTGELDADIRCAAFEIADGGVVNGEVHMLEEGEEMEEDTALAEILAGRDGPDAEAAGPAGGEDAAPEPPEEAVEEAPEEAPAPVAAGNGPEASGEARPDAGEEVPEEDEEERVARIGTPLRKARIRRSS